MTAGPAWVAAAETHRELVAGETLAVELTTVLDPDRAEPQVTVARV